MRIFCAQFIVVEENLWFSDSSQTSVLRRTTRQRIEIQLFSATGPEEAFRLASDMVVGFGDANNDGPGERTVYSCIGLYDLEEVSLFGRSLAEGLSEPYGLTIAVVDVADTAPVARRRQDLTLFKHP